MSSKLPEYFLPRKTSLERPLGSEINELTEGAAAAELTLYFQHDLYPGIPGISKE